MAEYKIHEIISMKEFAKEIEKEFGRMCSMCRYFEDDECTHPENVEMVGHPFRVYPDFCCINFRNNYDEGI